MCVSVCTLSLTDLCLIPTAPVWLLAQVKMNGMRMLFWLAFLNVCILEGLVRMIAFNQVRQQS